MACAKLVILVVLGAVLAFTDASGSSRRVQVVAAFRSAIKELDPLLTQVDYLVQTVEYYETRAVGGLELGTGGNISRSAVSIAQQLVAVAEAKNNETSDAAKKCVNRAEETLGKLQQRAEALYSQCDKSAAEGVATLIRPFRTYMDDVLYIITYSMVFPLYKCVNESDTAACIQAIVVDLYQKIDAEKTRLASIKEQLLDTLESYGLCLFIVSSGLVQQAVAEVERMNSCIPRIRRTG